METERYLSFMELECLLNIKFSLPIIRHKMLTRSTLVIVCKKREKMERGRELKM